MAIKTSLNDSIIQLLESRHDLYNQFSFIEGDPISIPHRYSCKTDIEISGFLSATLAWGQRKQTIISTRRIMQMMDDSPTDFILNHQANDLKKLQSFRHRTFGGDDLIYFVAALQNILIKFSSLENAFTQGLYSGESAMNAISLFRSRFLSTQGAGKTTKHISNPDKKSAAKRINMYLRWMVRHDNKGVDFGIWKTIKPSQLIIPLDVHTGNTARKLGLLSRKQNDRTAAEEITNILKNIDPADPVRFDFALFGIGAFERFTK